MPLDAIKRVFDDGGLDGLHDLDGRLLRAMRRDADEGGDAIGRAELLEQHPVASEVLESLAGAGLVASADGPFCTEEVEVVAAVHEMREAGLNEDLGFSVDQMGLYTAALQTLIDLELATFNERVLGAVSPERAAPMAHVAVEATSRMLGALHRRLLRDRLEGLVAATDSTKERQ